MRLFLVRSHMKCHLVFDKIWRNNPLRVRHWTPHFLILFTRYNQGLSGDPCHCAIKLIIFHKNYHRLRCLEVGITAGAQVIRLAVDFSCSRKKFGPRFDKVLIWFVNLSSRRERFNSVRLSVCASSFILWRWCGCGFIRFAFQHGTTF